MLFGSWNLAESQDRNVPFLLLRLGDFVLHAEGATFCGCQASMDLSSSLPKLVSNLECSTDTHRKQLPIFYFAVYSSN